MLMASAKSPPYKPCGVPRPSPWRQRQALVFEPSPSWWFLLHSVLEQTGQVAASRAVCSAQPHSETWKRLTLTDKPSCDWGVQRFVSRGGQTFPGPTQERAHQCPSQSLAPELLLGQTEHWDCTSTSQRAGFRCCRAATDLHRVGSFCTAHTATQARVRREKLTGSREAGKSLLWPV